MICYFPVTTYVNISKKRKGPKWRINIVLDRKFNKSCKKGKHTPSGQNHRKSKIALLQTVIFAHWALSTILTCTFMETLINKLPTIASITPINKRWK